MKDRSFDVRAKCYSIRLAWKSSRKIYLNLVQPVRARVADRVCDRIYDHVGGFDSRMP